MVKPEKQMNLNNPTDRNPDRHQWILHPVTITLLSLILTPAGGCLMAAYSLKQIGATIRARVVSGVTAPVLLGQFWVIWHFDLTVRGTLGLWTGLSLITGCILLCFYISAYKKYQKNKLSPRNSSFHFLGMLAGIFIGGMTGYFLLFFTSSGLSLIADALLSTMVPVNFSLENMLAGYIFTGILGILSGMILGGIVGTRSREFFTDSLYRLILSFLISAISTIIVSYFFVMIPAYQMLRTFSENITNPGFYVIGWFLVLIFIVYFTLFTARSKTWETFTKRTLLVCCSAIGLGLSFCIWTAMIPYDLFLFGKFMENRVQFKKAILCYEKSLLRNPNDKVQSFLKYRMALLQHKKGNQVEAIEGFQAVVSKYNSDNELVKKASKFLRNVKKADPEAKRVVIPGVETETEHKINYCAPNSFALNYRYWGRDISPKKVGRLFVKGDSGTDLLSALYHTRNLGFNFLINPLMTTEDLKVLIDHEIPVLVFIPGHVFVIFGYDEILQTFISYDTASKELWIEYPIDEFEEKWLLHLNRACVIFPDDQIEVIPSALKDRLKTATPAFIQYLLVFCNSRTISEKAQHLKQSLELYPDFSIAPVIARGYDHNVTDLLESDFDHESILNQSRLMFEIDPAKQHFDRFLLDFSIDYDFGKETLAFMKDIESKWVLESEIQERIAVLEYINGDLRSAVDRLQRNEYEIDSTLSYLGGEGSKILDEPATAGYFFTDYLEYIDDRQDNRFLSCGYFDRKASRYLISNSVTTAEKQSIRESIRNHLQYYPFDLPMVHALAMDLLSSGDEDDQHEAGLLLQRYSALSEYSTDNFESSQ